MKTLFLEKFGVQEMHISEMNDHTGGILLFMIGIAAALTTTAVVITTIIGTEIDTHIPIRNEPGILRKCN